MTKHALADPKNIQNQPVWLYSGTKDTVVIQGVVDKLHEYYTFYGADLKYVNNLVGEHTFPTDLPRNKNACTYLGTPFIGNCGFDGAGDMFKHVLPGQDKKPLKQREMNWRSMGELTLFDQRVYSNATTEAEFAASSLDELGYLYTPHTCKNGDAECQVHVAIHGCHQGRYWLKHTYVEDTGYLEWAGVNDIIVLFP